jgi:hypothetical protein
MAGIAPRRPEHPTAQLVQVGDFHVNELAADKAGSMSPFGEEFEFPLPVSQIHYQHPTRENRPHLAEGR